MAENDFEARLVAVVELMQQLTRTVQTVVDRMNELQELVEQQQTWRLGSWNQAARMH